MAESPKTFERPRLSFTVLLPARHEEQVIGETIFRLSKANYPKNLVNILLICDAGDIGTVDAAKAIIRKYDITNVQVITYSDLPISKPHGLNVGLKLAKNNVTVIFDAEDNVHPDIFNVANTLYNQTDADIIQAGTQLMDYDSRWFSSHNVLEYYFWFRSRMHFHAKVGMVPLGGNTVFFKTDQIKQMGGWSEHCLTEDAEIGIRMSTRGAKIIATYDAEHVTREETPATISQFIKQRTRWNQGFIQILKGKQWRAYDTQFKKLFCLYTLSFPFVQTILFIITPFIIILGFAVHMPVIITLFSFTPILIVAIQVIINTVGLYEFTNEQNLKKKLPIFILMVCTFGFYQILLGLGAIRATYRELRGVNNWEKTAHSGQHRQESIDKTLQAVNT
ncbi:MAG: glycosyltransferase [Methylophilaceae bacterium]|nr:glycosyltransferase [Methylophilaceae bacterium]